MKGNVPDKMASGKARLRDIADLLGLSVSTVSRALKDDPGSSADTRERVKHAAKLLGYRPNVLAQGLSTRSSRVLGLCTPPLHVGSYYVECSRPFERYVGERGYHLVHCNVEEDVYNLDEYLPLIWSGMFEGVFFLDYNFADPRKFNVTGELDEAGIPYVIVYDDPDLPPEGYNVVRVDFEEQACLAVRHLLDRGHSHIAMVAFPARGQFFDGYLRAYREANIPVDRPDLYNFKVGFLSDARLDDEARKIVESMALLNPPPTAMFVPKAILVGPLWLALKESGFVELSDIEMVAAKDLSVYNYFDQPLTVVSAGVDEIAKTAVSMMIAVLENRDDYTRHTVTVPSRLIVREPFARQRAESTSAAVYDPDEFQQGASVK